MTSKERARLRSLAAMENTIIQIGKNGITEQVIASVETALAARELIKGKVLESSMLTAREACETLAAACDAEDWYGGGVCLRPQRSAHPENRYNWRVSRLRPTTSFTANSSRS